VPARLPDYVRAALISWMYNVGEGNARNSTLIRKLRAGDITGACNELPRWSYAKGKHIRGLYNRRKDEQQLCLGEKK
jgi:lysozyme